MKFSVEKKGQKFHVVNQDTGQVRGVFAEETDAKAQCEKIQKEHDKAIEMASGKSTPPAAVA